MTDTIGIDDIGRMIRSAADKIRANRADCLNWIPPSVMEIMVRPLPGPWVSQRKSRESEKKDQRIAQGCRLGCMGVDGGATGPLLGSFLMGLVTGSASEWIDCPTLAACLKPVWPGCAGSPGSDWRQNPDGCPASHGLCRPAGGRGKSIAGAS